MSRRSASVFYKPQRERARQNTGMKPNIIPIVQYTDAPRAVEWLVRVLGFAKERVAVAPNDAASRAELRFGASPLVVSSAAAAVGPWRDVQFGIHVCTPDLADTATVRDPEGYLWSRGPSDCGGGDGEVTIVAQRHYRRLASAITWLRDALGFETTFEVPGPDGVSRHAEMRLGVGTIYVAPLSTEPGPFADVTQFPNLVVGDPDRHHSHAMAEGANVVISPRDTPFGARFYAVRDPENVLWWISTYHPAMLGEHQPASDDVSTRSRNA
jgi:uncharacterized glyoxalase superfamily protein PhnB